MVSETHVQELKKRLRGELILPGDDGYDGARNVFNAMIDRRPDVIVRCAGAADAIACVEFAREHTLQVAVRGGGHGIAGKAVPDGGLLIDLSRMKGIRVDPARRTVRAEAGLILNEFDKETQGFGLATPLGVVSTTGIAGLTLGGGLGWLSGLYGLACDNLISADVVTADGRLINAGSPENEDLFWGVRGGGGNFGIVTSFEYRLHEVGPVLGGAVAYPLAKAKAVLGFYRELAGDCPDELSTQAGFFTFPDGTPVVAVGGCYCGSLTEGEKVLKRLRTLSKPVADLFGPRPYTEMQSMLDGFFPAGRHHYWKSNFLSTFSDEGIETAVAYAAEVPSPHTFLWFPGEHMSGAASRVAPTETSFAHRRHPYNLGIFSNWTDPADSRKNIEWTRRCWDAMRPFMAAGTYVNYLEEEADPLARSAYGENYERLVALKNKYDPTNFFRLNHNIKPTV